MTDGKAFVESMRPVPSLDDLFGSVKLKQPVASAREEKLNARAAIANQASGEGLR